MDISATLAEIKALSIEDRINLVQEIWDSISAEVEQLELTEVQKQELSRRLNDHKANPSLVISWEEVRNRALARVKQ
jgi:putative addiction module component (TIGR02574 family)